MEKKKRNPEHKRLPDKDVSKKESQESAAKFSNPTSQGTHSDFPQSSVSQETLKKPIKDTKLFEFQHLHMLSVVFHKDQFQKLGK